MKVSFLISNAYSVGGTVRTVFTLANYLAEQGHEVEVITLIKKWPRPFFDLDPRVRLRPLIDLIALRKPGNGPKRKFIDWAMKRPSRLLHKDDKLYDDWTLLVDFKLLQVMAGMRSDVLVTTRPALSLFAARWCRRSVLRVAQEHNFVHSNFAGERATMKTTYPRLDGLVLLTDAHKRDWDEFIPGDLPPRFVIPNSVPTVGPPMSRQDNKLVIAVGRLSNVKRYDHLIRAFALVIEKRPDWKLRIYGAGPLSSKLRNYVRDHGLYNHVTLMGQWHNIDREFAKASLTAMSSESEGLPMTLIEAMLAGVPPVSYDCPHGPRSIITHGHDGLLVTNSEPEALAEGLLELINDEERRRAMGAAAVETARRYDTQVVGAQWLEVLEELRARKPDGKMRRIRPTSDDRRPARA